jgi:hypothetical protein
MTNCHCFTVHLVAGNSIPMAQIWVAVLFSVLNFKYVHIPLPNYAWIHVTRSHSSICGSTALCGTLAAFSVSWSIMQLVGLLGWGISPLQGHYLHTGQHEYRINAHRYPCLKWDSNPRSQCLSGRRQFVQPLRSAHLIYNLKNKYFISLLKFLSLVQGKLTNELNGTKAKSNI